MTDNLKIRTATLNNLIDFIANEFLEKDMSIASPDMYSEFLKMYTDDGIHYNDAGSKFIADQYKDVISDYFENNIDLQIGERRIAG